MLKKHHAKAQQVIHHKTSGESEQPLHVMIEDPINLRKSVLSSALDVTKLLKTYTELKEIRKSKAMLTETFISLHTDIKKIVRDFEKELPKLSIPELNKENNEKVETIEHVESKPAVTQKIGSSEIDSLKAELEEIEKKLGNL